LAKGRDLLVSDADRERTADELRAHYEAGRLTLDEFLERIDEAHAARTARALEHALRQLPDARLPTVSPRDTRWRSLVTQYAFVNAIAILIWLFGGAEGDFWPKWVFLVTLILFTRRVSRARRRSRRLPPPGRRAR
jgi:fatty acid desaturase